MSETKELEVKTAGNPAEQAPVEQSAPPESTPVKKNKNGAEKKKRKLPKPVKIAILAVILAAVVFGAVMLVRNLLKKEEMPGMNSAMVTRGRLESYVSGWGTTTSKSKAELGKDLKGKVLEVNVSSGDRVKEGDVIFSVDPEEMQKELDDALTELDRVNDSLTEAQNAITNLTVTAPFKGKLVSVEDLKEGQQLGTGGKVGVLVDDSKMKLSLYFSYGYIDEITKGMQATISVPSSMANIPGTVESVEKVRKITQDGSVLFKVNFTMQNPGTLTKDMIASAVIETPSGDAMPSEAGKLEFNREEEILAKSSGEILSVAASEYHEYTAGAALVTMKNDSLKTSLSSAQRSYDAAAKKVRDLEKSLAECVQTTPIDGVVTGVMIEPGDELNASGTPVVTVADLTKIVIDINIDEMEISKVSAGMQVEITQDKVEGPVMMMGELTSVSLEAKSDGGGGGMGGGVSYFPARISIADPGDLMPGIGVQYKISALVKDDCLLVPSGAVIYAMDGSTVVFVKNEQLTPDQTPFEMPKEQAVEGYTAVSVAIGLADDMNTEILSGLEEGQEINNPSVQDPRYGHYGGMMMY